MVQHISRTRNECQYSTLASPTFLCHYPSVTPSHLLGMGGLCKKQGLTLLHSGEFMGSNHRSCWKAVLQTRIWESRWTAGCSSSAQHWQSCIWRKVSGAGQKRDRDILERVQLKATEVTKGSELLSHEKSL